jgi:hypothetical protein
MRAKSVKSDSNKKKKEALIKNLEAGNTVTKACNNVKVSRDTYYRWKHEDEAFAKAVIIAKESRIEIVEDANFASAVKGNVTAQIFFLCNRDPNRWKHVSRVEHSGKLTFDLAEEFKALENGGDKAK